MFSCQESSDLTFNDTKVIRSQLQGLDFNEVKRRVLTPYCIQCHKSYSNYSTVYSKRKSILKSILTNKMPEKREPLSRELKNLVNDWVKAGAVGSSPQNGNGRAVRGLSKKMQELYAKHKNHHSVLDKETPLKLSTDGEKVKVEFDSGNTGELQYKVSKSIKLVTRIDFVENTCGNFKPQACFLVTHANAYRKRLAWVEHTDATKINKTVEYARKDDQGEPEGAFEKVEELMYYGVNIKKLSPKLNQGTKDYLICENWVWGNQEKVKVLSFNAEQMGENPETKMNENRTIGGLYNMDLNRFNKYVYQLNTPEFIDSSFGRQSLIHIFGEAGSIFYQAESNKQCMLGFKMDYNSIVAEITAIEDDPGIPYKSYHLKQDNTYDERTTEEQFNRLIKSAKEGVVK